MFWRKECICYTCRFFFRCFVQDCIKTLVVLRMKRMKNPSAFFALEDSLGNIYDVLAGNESLKEYIVCFGEDTLNTDMFCSNLPQL